MIELTLFDTTELHRDDPGTREGVENGTDLRDFLAQPRPVALLAYLAAAGDRPGIFHRRDKLAGLFWPETDQEHSRANLRGLLHTIRRYLGDVIEIRGDEELRVNPELLRCDAMEFQDAIRRSRYARADELYRGEFMPGFFVPRAPVPEFDNWLAERRTELAEAAAETAWKLATLSETGANLTDASRYARRAARLAVHDERRFRRAIDLLARVGNGGMAVVLYDELCRRLADLDARPSPETRKLIDEIRNR